MFISIRWEAILWVVTSSIFRRLSKNQKRPFCKLLALGSAKLLQKKQNKKIPNLSVFDKNAFLQRYVERDIWSAHPPQKISKPSLFFNFFINQTFLVNIYAENTANLQNRAGRDFFLVVCNLQCAVATVILCYERHYVLVKYEKNWDHLG